MKKSKYTENNIEQCKHHIYFHYSWFRIIKTICMYFTLDKLYHIIISSGLFVRAKDLHHPSELSINTDYINQLSNIGHNLQEHSFDYLFTPQLYSDHLSLRRNLSINENDPNSIMYDDNMSFTFTVIGNYVIQAPIYYNTTYNQTTSNAQYWNKAKIIDEGKIKANLYTRNMLIHSIPSTRLALSMKSQRYKNHQMHLVLSGLNLRDTKALVLQKSIHINDLNLPKSEYTDYLHSNNTELCTFIGNFLFTKDIYNSVSVRHYEHNNKDGMNSQVYSALNNNVDQKSTENVSEPNEIYSPFRGIVVSENCRLRILIAADEVNLRILKNKVLLFMITYAVKTIVQVYLFINQMKLVDESISAGKKISLFSQQINTWLDCFEAILLLVQVLTADFMKTSFLIMAFFKILFVSIIEVRYMFIILKTQYGESIHNRAFLNYIKLYILGSTLIFCIILKIIPLFQYASLLLYAIWIPQILLSIKTGQKRALNLQFAIGITLCHTFFPFYLWCNSQSIFDGVIYVSITGSQNLTVGIILIIFLTAQLALIVIQHYFGPRCFVPWIFLPNVYNYYRPFTRQDDLEKNGGTIYYECIICMTGSAYGSKSMVITPCNHVFHEKCLEQWMDIKFECPVCRQTIPPLT